MVRVDGYGIRFKIPFDVVLDPDIRAAFLDETSIKGAIHCRSFAKSPDHMAGIKCFSGFKLQLEMVFLFEENSIQHLLLEFKIHAKGNSFFIKIVIKSVAADTESTQIKGHIHTPSACARKLKTRDFSRSELRRKKLFALEEIFDFVGNVLSTNPVKGVVFLFNQ